MLQISETSWDPIDYVPEWIKTAVSNISNKLNGVVCFIEIVGLLKKTKRQGWINKRIPHQNVESVSDHMYRMSIMSWIFSSSDIDLNKCIKMSLIHDIAESLVTDITPDDLIPKDEKIAREFKTINYLLSLINNFNCSFANEILDLWMEYEENASLEAKYVKDLDKYEMIQQAWEYEKISNFKFNLTDFYHSINEISNAKIKEVCEKIIKERNLKLTELKKNSKL